MPDYLHRTTKRHLRSVSPNSLPESIANYILTPDLSAVTGQPVKYWVVTGDVITLADQGTRDTIDVAEIETQNEGLAANLDRVLRAFILCINDGTIIPNSNLTNLQIKNRIKSKL